MSWPPLPQIPKSTYPAGTNVPSNSQLQPPLPIGAAKSNGAAKSSGITPGTSQIIQRAINNLSAPHKALVDLSLGFSKFADSTSKKARQALTSIREGSKTIAKSTYSAIKGENKTQNANSTDKPESYKTALPEFLLKAIMKGSSFLKAPGLSDALTRKESRNFVSTEIKAEDFKLKEEKVFTKERYLSPENLIFDKAKERFQDYSVFATYPTSKVELTDAHSKYLQELNTGGKNSLAIMEIYNSSNTGKPVFKDLSPEARLILSKANLGVVQEHLKDIEYLANNTENTPNLAHLGMNYFENEAYDTLARGLAFIDKSLLKDPNLIIEVPLKQADGSFKLEKFTVERFNLSGTPGENRKIDHSDGHPIFFLTPTEKGVPPIIVARGTLVGDDGHDGAKESIQADTRKDISMKWVVGNPEIQAKMEQLHHDFGKAKVCGYSLGGNIAALMCVRFPHLIDSAVTTSAVHVSEDIYQAWQSIPETMRPKVTNIMVEGDVVPAVGKKIIGYAVLAEQQTRTGSPDLKESPVERHLKPFNNTNVRYAVVDKEKEMDKFTRAAGTFAELGMQDKEGIQNLRGSGLRDRTLDQLNNEIKAIKITPLNNPSLAELEKATPAEIKTLYKDGFSFKELIDKHGGVDKFSNDLLLKIYISLPGNENVSFFSAVVAHKPELGPIFQMHQLQKD